MPPSLPAALPGALHQIAAAFAAADIPWLVAGSTARALLGFTTVPQDLDIEVPTRTMEAAATALGLTASEERDTRAWSHRATGVVADVPVDLTAGLTLTGPGGVLPPDFDIMEAFATHVDVAQREIPVMPLEEQIVRILITGDEARRQRFIAESPPGYVARDDYVSARLGSARAAR